MTWNEERTAAGELLDLTARRPAWHAGAACKEADRSITWFPVHGDSRPAKAICARCPVHDDCRTWSLDQGVALHGIWAGLSGQQRDALRKLQRPAA